MSIPRALNPKMRIRQFVREFLTEATAEDVRLLDELLTQWRAMASHEQPYPSKFMDAVRWLDRRKGGAPKTSTMF
jgi:hypothetical protein